MWVAVVLGSRMLKTQSTAAHKRILCVRPPRVNTATLLKLWQANSLLAVSADRTLSNFFSKENNTHPVLPSKRKVWSFPWNNGCTQTYRRYPMDKGHFTTVTLCFPAVFNEMFIVSTRSHISSLLYLLVSRCAGPSWSQYTSVHNMLANILYRCRYLVPLNFPFYVVSLDMIEVSGLCDGMVFHDFTW